MNKYGFYAEFDGKQSLPVEISRPEETMISETMLSSIKAFARKKGTEVIGVDELKDGAMRAYFRKKKWFHKNPEIIYYVSEITDRDS
ncbi:hypothetical protein ABNN70_07195 [Sporolactobacillus sp. Y61]|jgi:hypothetical protein|uniref:Uncharacterized protein n=1 Tax=Sporolactobacillus sp. Y61 TaxID=3160863 RepID=A0AAU8IJT4_9BACL|nr:hypothetical protein [Sporolactobacillus sp. THM19-2]RYL89277.1 hypothetical protein EWH91_10990 [Sporolactobacillus sp. THM19-2]